jgi:hypothetical protein
VNAVDAVMVGKPLVPINRWQALDRPIHLIDRPPTRRMAHPSVRPLGPTRRNPDLGVEALSGATSPTLE